MSAEVATDTLLAISRELETQSLNSVVAGFSFAAALSWMDLVRWTIHQVVKVQKNGGMNYALTALFHHSPVCDCIHGHFPCVKACQEARGPRLRDHTLIRRGLVNIKKNIPVTIIINI